MPNDLVGLVLNAEIDLKSVERLVLLHMAYVADENNRSTLPHLSTFERKLNMTKTPIVNAIEALAKKGYITEYRRGLFGQNNIYTIEAENLNKGN